MEGRAAASIEAVFREERGLLLAALVRRFGDLDLAEEVTSEAIEAALVRWPVDGVPPKPGAWLMTTARRKAVDRLRRDQAYAARLAGLQVEAERGVEEAGGAKGGRRAAPRPGLRGRARGAAGGGGAGGARPGVRRRPAGRAAPAVLHLRPPGAARRRPDGVDPALPGRPDDAGGGARVPGAQRDDGQADRAGEEPDPRGAHPVPGAVRRRAAGPAAGRAAGRLLDLHRGVRGEFGPGPAAARPGGRGDPPGPDPAPAAAGGAGSRGAAGADAADPRAPRDAHGPGRRPGAPRRPGPRPLGSRDDRGGC